MTTIGGSKKQPVDVHIKKYTKAPSSADVKTDENFPVLKIEEDLDVISTTGCKTTSTSTQTSPIQEVTNKKGSTSTIWTSEESILRSADTVDEDNKSTSSSACEETGVAMSSDKSGEFCLSILIALSRYNLPSPSVSYILYNVQCTCYNCMYVLVNILIFVYLVQFSLNE